MNVSELAVGVRSRCDRALAIALQPDVARLLLEMMRADPPPDPQTKAKHGEHEEDRMDDLPALPPDLRDSPLAAALPQIHGSHSALRRGPGMA